MNLKLTTGRDSRVDYLLGDRSANGEQRQSKPEIIAGDAWSIQCLDTKRHDHRYLLGNISWSESIDEIDRSTLMKVVASLQKLLIGGLPPQACAPALWVLHRRLQGTDVHLCIPQVHLPSGRPMSLVSLKNDRLLLDAWRHLWNLRERWTDPHDGSARFLRGVYRGENQAEPVVKKWNRIDRTIGQLVASGDIASTRQLISEFSNLGLRVEQVAGSGIVLRTPSGDVLHFSGGKFTSDFNFSDVRNRIQNNRINWWRSGQKEIPQLERFVHAGTIFRGEDLAKTYSDSAPKANPVTGGQRMEFAKNPSAALKMNPGDSDREFWDRCLRERAESRTLAAANRVAATEVGMGTKCYDSDANDRTQSPTNGYNTNLGSEQNNKTYENTENEEDCREDNQLARLLRGFARGLAGLYSQRGEWLKTIRRVFFEFVAGAERMHRGAREILERCQQPTEKNRNDGDSHSQIGRRIDGGEKGPEDGRDRQSKHGDGAEVLRGAARPPVGLLTPLREMRMNAESDARWENIKARVQQTIAKVENLPDDPDKNR